MYKRLIAIATAITGFMFMTPGVAQAYDYVTTIDGVSYKCTNYTDRHNWTALPDSNKSLFLQVTVGYRRCVPFDDDRYNFIEPNYAIFSMNIEGSGYPGVCNPVTRLWDGSEFNMYYYSPLRGTNFNPGSRHLECSDDTVSSEMQDYSYDDTPRLFYGPGTGDDAQPRWKVNMKAERNFAPDIDHVHYQDFNWAE